MSVIIIVDGETHTIEGEAGFRVLDNGTLVIFGDKGGGKGQGTIKALSPGCWQEATRLMQEDEQ